MITTILFLNTLCEFLIAASLVTYAVFIYLIYKQWKNQKEDWS